MNPLEKPKTDWKILQTFQTILECKLHIEHQITPFIYWNAAFGR